MIGLRSVVLPRTTVTAGAVAYLREDIISGVLRAGEPLPEARLGESLGVSRAPVREALTLLEREGLVEFDRRGTARVCSFGLDAVRELALMRLALEPLGARLACGRIPSDIDIALTASLEMTRTENDVVRMTVLDLEFHRLLMRAAGNRRLLLVWEGLASQFRLCMTRFHQRLAVEVPQFQLLTYRGHSDILATMRSGPPERAEAEVRRSAELWFPHLEAAFANQTGSNE